MRKLLFVLCIFIMCGCSSVEKIEEDEFTHYQIASDLPALYGGGYRIVEAWNGFKVEEFVGTGDNRKGNEVFRNEDFAIENKLVNSFGNQFTYIYNDGTKISELYTGMSNTNRDIYPQGVSVFQMGDYVYFTYYDIYDLVVNRVDDGKLIEYKRIPLKDDTYEFKAFVYNENEMYHIYINDKNIKYVCDEREYIFNITDRVNVLKDYILYSTYEFDEVSGTYIVNRKTNEAVQYEENIDLVLDALYDSYPVVNNSRFKNNCFVFIENVEGKKTYAYASIIDNTFKKIQLPYSYYERDRVQFYSEQTIFLTKTNSKANYDFYVIEIK